MLGSVSKFYLQGKDTTITIPHLKSLSLVSGLSFSQHHSASQDSLLDGLPLPVLPHLCSQRCPFASDRTLLSPLRVLFLTPGYFPYAAPSAHTSLYAIHVLLVKEAVDTKKTQEHICSTITVMAFSCSFVYMCTTISPYSWGFVPRSTVGGPKLWVVPNPICYFFFLYMYTFSLIGSTLWLLFSIFQLLASLLLCFGAIIKLNKLLKHKHCNTMTVNLITKKATA